MQKLRVLDFGAGAVPFPVTLFSTIQKDQDKTISYDPKVKQRTNNSFPSQIDWTDEVPKGQFDLIVCNFSLHHIVETPSVQELTQKIQELRESYSVKLIGIADYDYKGKHLSEFTDTFIAEGEQKELKSSQFGSNEQACFEFHSRFGLSEYQAALIQNGFRVVESQHGQGIARNKFFLIGSFKS